jgi:hypothetical protein
MVRASGGASSNAVQSHVTVFNSIISEETASAATAMPADASHADKPIGSEMVVRHGAGFRIIRTGAGGAAAAAEAAADGGAAAAADTGGDAAAAAAAQAAGERQQQQQQQRMGLLRDDFVSRMQVRRA